MIKYPKISVNHVLLILTVLSFWTLSLIGVILVIPIFLFRLFIAKIGVRCRKDLGKILTSSATLFNQKRLNIVATFYVQGDLDVSFMRDFFMRKVILLQNFDGELKYPELQQYVQSWAGFYFWKWDKEFDIKNHIHSYDASQHSNHEDLMEYLESTPFPEDKSPWNFLLLENCNQLPNHLQTETSETNSNISVVVFHASHAMFDCFSLYNLMLFKTMAGQDLIALRNPQRLKSKSHIFIRVLRSITFWWRRTVMFCTDENSFYDTNSLHSMNMDKNYEPDYAIATAADPIPAKLVREIRDKHNVCTNAVILSCVTAGLRKMMKSRSLEIPRTMRLYQNYPRKNHPEKLRNHFYNAEANLPTGIADVDDRLFVIEKEVNKCKEEITQPTLQLYHQILGLMPHFVVRNLFRMNIATVLLSNFAIPGDLTLFDKNVLHCHFINGIADGNPSILVSCLGYGENLQINVQLNTDFVKKEDKHEIFKYIYEELEILKNSSNCYLPVTEV